MQKKTIFSFDILKNGIILLQYRAPFVLAWMGVAEKNMPTWLSR